MDVKVRRRGAAKEIIVDGVKYKSLLEGAAATLLKEAGLEFKYEPTKYVLLEGFKGQNFCVEEDKLSPTNIQVTYTPDFVGPYWIMETKGMKTPDFMIKWKFFKQKLEEEGDKKILFMPRNKKQIMGAIKKIKNLRVFQECFMMIDVRIAYINKLIREDKIFAERMNEDYATEEQRNTLMKAHMDNTLTYDEVEELIYEAFPVMSNRLTKLERLIPVI